MDLNDIRPASTPTNIPQASPMPQTPKHSYRPIVVSVVVLIALIILGFLFMRAGSRPAAYDDAGNPVYKAPDGKLIEGFPRELLVGDAPVPSESYRIEYGADNTQQMTTSYTTALSYIDTIAAYKDFLERNTWTITRYANYYELPTTFFYATKDGMQVNITITSNDGLVGVVVTRVAAN